MRTVDMEHVLRGAYDLCGLDAASASNEDFKIIRRALSRALSTAYERELWPDLIRVEKRYFRNLFTSGSSLTAPTLTAVSEVFYPQAGGYFQALRDLPLTVSSITRSSNTATVTTAADHLLATGDQVAISGAVETDYNVYATVTVTAATTFTYAVANTPSTPATGTIRCTPTPADALGETQLVYWAESATCYEETDWDSTETNILGDIRYWHGTDRHYVYYNSTSSSGNQPTSTTYWRILTDFDRYVAWAQTGKTDLNGASILATWSREPRNRTSGGEVPFVLSSNGIQIARTLAEVWVEYRQKPPQLKGENFSATATYASGGQAYYSSSTAAGNFYDANQSTTAGDTPESAASKWDVVLIPYDFERYLVQAAYADWLRADGQADKAAGEGRKADDLLDDLQAKLRGAQQQRSRTTVLTR